MITHSNENTPKRLCELSVGERAVVKTINCSNKALLQRLLCMGIVAGTAVELLCIAPLGDPIQIQALGYRLSLRVSEARSIEVVPLTQQVEVMLN